MRFFDNSICQYVKEFIFLLIGLGVALEKGAFLAIAALIAIITALFDIQRFSNLRNKSFTKTIMLFLIYVGTVACLSLLNWDLLSLKMVLRDFEKIASFLIVYLLLGKTKNAFFFGSLGFVIGVLIGEASVLQSYIFKTSSFGKRFGGVYGHPNSLGSVMELTIPFLIFSLYQFRNRIGFATLVGIALLSSSYCLFLSGSRGAILAVVGELWVILAIYAYRRFKIKSYKKLLLFTCIACITSMLIYVYSSPRNYDSERILLWTAAWKMFLDHPLIGVGFSNWKIVYKAAYVSPLAKEPNLPHCHNFYLHLLSTTGIIGTVAYFNLLFGQLKMSVVNSLKEYRLFRQNINISDMFVAIICGLLIHNVVDINAVWRYYLLKLFFIWALCCLRFQELEDMGPVKGDLSR